jgi:hypothetical protein
MNEKSLGYDILEKTPTSLSIKIYGMGFSKFLFYLSLLVLCISSYGIAIFSMRYATQFKVSVQVFAYFFMGLGLMILYRLAYSFFYQAFDFIHSFEKDQMGTVYHNLSKGDWNLGKTLLPDPVDFLDFQVRSYGLFGFQIYAFGTPSKENLLRGNFLLKLSNVLFHSPLIRYEFRFHSPTEAKEMSRSLLFEIKSFLRKKEISKPQKKNSFMKIGLTLEELQQGLKKGINVQERDGIIGNPVLFYAAGTDPELPPYEWQEPNYSLLAELIRAGADVNACNLYNERIIDYIIRGTAHTGENPAVQRLRSFLESYGYRRY